MARQRTVLGIPVGKKKPSIAPKLIAAGAGIAAVPAIAAARKAGGMVSSGRDQVRKVTDIANTASGIVESVGQHSSTIGKVGAVIGEVRKLGGDGDGNGAPKLSHLIEEHIEVAVPRSVAYNQWTQFELFPNIVKGAESVEQKRDDRLEWTSKIGPSRRSWQGEITEQVPDERIAWKSKGGLQLGGVVTFHSLDDDLTRVLVEMEYDPKGPVEHVGNLLRVQRRRVRRDLRLFKHFVELRGEETGAWRGRIQKKDEDGKSRGSGRGSRSSSSSNSSSSKSRSKTSAKATSGARSSSGSSGSNRSSSNGKRASSNATKASSNGTRSASNGKSSASNGRSSASNGKSSASNGRSSTGSSRSNGKATSGARKAASGTASKARKTASGSARKTSSAAKSASKSASGTARKATAQSRKAS